MGGHSRPAPPIFPENRVPLGRWRVSRKAPERELEEFLGSLPSWKRRLLLYDYDGLYSDAHDRAAWEESGCELLVNDRTQNQYEEIIRQIPSAWKSHLNKKRGLSPLLVAKGRPGRPRKQALAAKARHLLREGRNNPQIAEEINKEYGEGTTTPEAVRKLLSRYPDKT
jgi:hypothetical protein